jgi:hypothetical protein
MNLEVLLLIQSGDPIRQARELGFFDLGHCR